LKGFFGELRRRKVFRMAGFYIVGAWLVMQAADVFFPAWDLPDAALNVLLVAAVVGFPLALVFGWFYDVTTHGIVRTPSSDAAGVGEPASLKRTDYLVLAALAVIAIVILLRAGTEIAETPRVEIAATADEGAFEIPASETLPNSIAVLPFANISSDPENEIFCDGISEEILNKLGAFSDLHVIARTSSFAFKGSDYGVPRISRTLGVRYLLQGSVRKAGDQLRISAQLVDDTGAQRWSKTFDRQLENVFDIQAEIADVVASTVVPQITHQSASAYEPGVDAYQHFLAGREFVHQRNPEAAIRELEKAIELAPDFPDAQAELAIAVLIGPWGDEGLGQATEAIDTALALRPGFPRALAARGLLLQQQRSPDWPGSEAALRKALEGDPNMVDAMNWLGNALAAQGADVGENKALLERAAQIDPLHPSIAVNLANVYVEEGATERAERMLLRLTEMPNPAPRVFANLRTFYLETGQLVKMNAIEKRLALTGLHVYYGLALNYAVLAEYDQAAYWVARMKKDFQNFWFRPYADMNIPMWRGEYAEAARVFHEAMREQNVGLADLGPFLRRPLGHLRALAGDYSGAVEALASDLADAVDQSALDLDQSEAYQDLAWSYLKLGEAEKAHRLLSAVDTLFRKIEQQGRLQLSPELYLYALNTLMLGDYEFALDRFERAIDAGWREYYITNHDPRWAVLADNERYQALVARVRDDVDRQRAEVDAIDAAEDFPALLDRVQAARQ